MDSSESNGREPSIKPVQGARSVIHHEVKRTHITRPADRAFDVLHPLKPFRVQKLLGEILRREADCGKMKETDLLDLRRWLSRGQAWVPEHAGCAQRGSTDQKLAPADAIRQKTVVSAHRPPS